MTSTEILKRGNFENFYNFTYSTIFCTLTYMGKGTAGSWQSIWKENSCPLECTRNSRMDIFKGVFFQSLLFLCVHVCFFILSCSRNCSWLHFCLYMGKSIFPLSFHLICYIFSCQENKSILCNRKGIWFSLDLRSISHLIKNGQGDWFIFSQIHLEMQTNRIS